MNVTHNEDFVQSWVPYHQFQEWVVKDRYRFIHNENWTYDPAVSLAQAREVLGKLDVIGQTTAGNKIQCMLLRLEDGTLVTVREWRGDINLDIATSDEQTIAKIVKKLRQALPPLKLKKSDKPRIMVNFMNVKNSYARTLDAAKWEQIAINYPEKVRKELQVLMDRKPSTEIAGQLMLWHGLPGTGKTWALRVLGYEWRSWAEVVYIVDPETFFGDSIYMMNTLMSHLGPDYYDDDDENENIKIPRKDRWKLLVAEDTGELLSADAKSRTGQGLSRLLNIVDGMIGQGLRVMVLITTNEKLGALHPAVTRPGRAAGVIEFEAFSANEANQWLAAHNRPARKANSPITLAELYNEKEKAPERKVGFGVAA